MRINEVLQREKLNFDSLYGKAFKITYPEGDKMRPGFSIITPIANKSVWNDWEERPEFKNLVRQKLNDPNFLADYKYQQIIDAAKVLKLSRINEVLKKYSDPGYKHDYSNLPDYVEKPSHLDNPDRGPHEGKELGMMLKGEKPAAIVRRAVYHEFFEKYVKAGKLIAKPATGRNVGDIVVVVPGEEWRLNKIIQLLHPLELPGSYERYSIKLGRLLGYTKDQVRYFLKTTQKAYNASNAKLTKSNQL